MMCSDTNTNTAPIGTSRNDHQNGSKVVLAQVTSSLVHIYTGANSIPSDTLTSVTATVNVAIPAGNRNSKYPMPFQVGP